MDIPSLNYAAHKFFLLIANYPKYKGDHFKLCIEVNHPGASLAHIMNEKESKQDICIDTAPCFYMNHPYWIEFLDKLICYGKIENKLERSLWIALTSIEYITVTHAISIVKFAISDQLQYLAAYAHEFLYYY